VPLLVDRLSDLPGSPSFVSSSLRTTCSSSRVDSYRSWMACWRSGVLTSRCPCCVTNRIAIRALAQECRARGPWDAQSQPDATKTCGAKFPETFPHPAPGLNSRVRPHRHRLAWPSRWLFSDHRAPLVVSAPAPLIPVHGIQWAHNDPPCPDTSADTGNASMRSAGNGRRH
jgi:hypothetical protein